MIRLAHHYFSARKSLLVGIEGGAIAFGCAAGVVAAGAGRQWAQSSFPTGWFVALALVYALVLQFFLYLLDLYDLRAAHEDQPSGLRLLRAAGLALLTLAVAALFARNGPPRGWLLAGALGAMAGCLAVRAGLSLVLGVPRRVLLIGRAEVVAPLAKAISEDGAHELCVRLEPEAVISGGNYWRLDAANSPVRQLSLRQHAQGLRASVIVHVAQPREPVDAQLEDALLECRLAGFEVHDSTGFFERSLRRLPVHLLRPSSLAFAEELHVGSLRRALKRAFDLAAAFGLAVLFAPVMLVVAVLVRLDSPGPVFYRQERVGQDGRIYRLWKFRSMRVDAERDGPVWAREGDDRVTRLGRILRKARLDELPQLLNVLSGDMSFVGPRPERPVFVERLEKEVPFYAVRKLVKPGITGWAQLRYPYGASVEDARNKLEYDLYYVKNGTLLLDLAIMFHTVRHVLQGRGAR